jgi:hypothetical protein
MSDNQTAIQLLLFWRRTLYRFEKRLNPQMRYNWRIALLFLLDRRMVALSRHALSDWYGDVSTSL